MKELYNAPKAEVISFVAQENMAAWGKGLVWLSIDIADVEDYE